MRNLLRKKPLYYCVDFESIRIRTAFLLYHKQGKTRYIEKKYLRGTKVVYKRIIIFDKNTCQLFIKYSSLLRQFYFLGCSYLIGSNYRNIKTWLLNAGIFLERI